MALTDIEAGRLADNIFNVVGANKNLIINGAMQVAQRGTSGTVTNAVNYLVDRYYGIAQNANVTQSHESSVVPTGFKNSLKFEVTSAGNTGYLQCAQRIEGQNMAHLNFGTANAVQFTLSFYVRSSITGDYSIAFRNASDNRSYVTTYNIATANTWERKTVTLTGDTTGTWATDNGHGMSVIWTLGYSSSTSAVDQWTATGNFAADSSVDLYETNGATWYITGVQLEVGSVATPFEHSSFSDELLRCMRYFEKSLNYGTAATTATNPAPTLVGSAYSASNIRTQTHLKVPKRATPTVTPVPASTGGTGTQWARYNGSWAAANTSIAQVNENAFSVDLSTSGVTGFQTYIIDGNWYVSAEL